MSENNNANASRPATVRIAPNLRLASAAQILGIGGFAAGDRAMEVFQAIANGEIRLGR